jgi:hypothetical protein
MGLKNYEQAGVCNLRALDVMPFGAATAILKSLIEQWEPHRHEDPLEEVARYLMN